MSPKLSFLPTIPTPSSTQVAASKNVCARFPPGAPVPPPPRGKRKCGPSVGGAVLFLYPSIEQTTSTKLKQSTSLRYLSPSSAAAATTCQLRGGCVGAFYTAVRYSRPDTIETTARHPHLRPRELGSLGWGSSHQQQRHKCSDPTDRMGAGGKFTPKTALNTKLW